MKTFLKLKKEAEGERQNKFMYKTLMRNLKEFLSQDCRKAGCTMKS